MSRMAAAGRNVKKAAPKADVKKTKFFTYIPAQMATPGPPLGSNLGEIGINISSFVKDFNLRTSIFKPGVPIPSFVTVNPDRTYNLSMNHPPWPYFIKQAAGIQRGAMEHEKEISGYITRRHVYEIAKLKSEDNLFQEVDLKLICGKIIDMAYQMGVHVVDELDPKEYGEFLKKREEINKEQREKIDAIKEAKLLRTLVQETKAAK